CAADPQVAREGVRGRRGLTRSPVVQASRPVGADPRGPRFKTDDQPDRTRNGLLSLAKTSSALLRGAPRSFNLSTGPRPRAWFEARATAIFRPSALHGHTGVAMEDGERAGWAAALDL